MAENSNVPFEIKDVEPELNEELVSQFTAQRAGFVRVGPKGYILPKKHEREAVLYYNMPVQTSDVFIIGIPRSGTTLTTELVWLLGSNFDYKKAAEVNISSRFPWLEASAFFHSGLINGWLQQFEGNDDAINKTKNLVTPVTERLRKAPLPRFIKTHLPPSLLPPPLLNTARVVYIARDPRDVAVSFYHLSRSLNFFVFKGDFKTFWNFFIKDLVFATPYFEHVKEGWENRHNPNVLFLFYYELTKDMPKTIRKVATFLDKQITNEQVAKLTDHLKIDNCKKNKSINGYSTGDTGFLLKGEEDFIRKGKVGGWREYFDEEMTQQAERWIADNLRGSDLRFPSMDGQ